MFIPPDIMEPEMLLAYAERLADLAEQSAGRHKLIQFKELIEGLSALGNDENAGMSSAAIASLRGTVIYWQDVVLNHFEKAEKQRIMGLFSFFRGPQTAGKRRLFEGRTNLNRWRPRFESKPRGRSVPNLASVCS